jgi:MFS family permease
MNDLLSAQLTRLQSALRIDSRLRAIILFSAAVFLYWMSLYVYMPTLPVYVQTKTDDLALIGLVLSMYGLWQGVIRLPLGIAVDWSGRRKPFIIAGFLLSALGAIIMGVSGGVNGLMIGRTITGLAAGTWVPLVVTFSLFFPPEDTVRASSILLFVGTLGRLSATGLTGFLNEWGGYSLAFYLATVIAGLAIVAVLFIKETPFPPKRPTVSAIGALITRRDVLLPAVLSAIGQYMNWGLMFGFVPLLATTLKASGLFLSLLISLSLVTFALGNFMATALAEKIGAQLLVIIGFALLSLGGLAAAFTPNLPVLLAAQLCMGLAQGMTNPVLMGLSIRRVAAPERTTAMGLHQAVYAIGMFAGPWLSGILAGAIGIRPMMAVTAGVILVLGRSYLRGKF